MFAGKRIVYTAGTWDLCHLGHLRIIERAKTYGDILIVGVSTDELVTQYKKEETFNSYIERFTMIDSLKWVDFTVKQTELISIHQMKILNVDVLVLGDDWVSQQLDGIDWMQLYGSVIFLPRTVGISTSSLKHKLRILEGDEAGRKTRTFDKNRE